MLLQDRLPNEIAITRMLGAVVGSAIALDPEDEARGVRAKGYAEVDPEAIAADLGADE
jgi:hypothetical protein